MIDIRTENKLNSDFSDFNNILTNNNHVVRKFYNMFINGDYGQELFEEYKSLWEYATNKKRQRAFVINSFINNIALDYSLKDHQVRYWLKKNIGVKKLELLNEVLIADCDRFYYNYYKSLYNE